MTPPMPSWSANLLRTTLEASSKIRTLRTLSAPSSEPYSSASSACFRCLIKTDAQESSLACCTDSAAARLGLEQLAARGVHQCSRAGFTRPARREWFQYHRCRNSTGASHAHLTRARAGSFSDSLHRLCVSPPPPVDSATARALGRRARSDHVGSILSIPFRPTGRNSIEARLPPGAIVDRGLQVRQQTHLRLRAALSAEHAELAARIVSCDRSVFSSRSSLPRNAGLTAALRLRQLRHELTSLPRSASLGLTHRPRRAT